ncbi:hypothetical protein LCGC14_0427180 [marine sediment metagenome]|uniref:Uncharacterized protein n=1 Tax=marine sediment metagenome TaxID=412755 RepID=A0A0F9VBA9_9ZZZZ
MRTASKRAKEIVAGVSRRRLNNNTQRVLFSLVKAASNGGWVARTTLRVPSVGARIRDLRKPLFGGFEVECASATDLNRTRPSSVTERQTFYRIVPGTVTVSALRQALKGVI